MPETILSRDALLRDCSNRSYFIIETDITEQSQVGQYLSKYWEGTRLVKNYNLSLSTRTKCGISYLHIYGSTYFCPYKKDIINLLELAISIAQYRRR